MKRAAFIVLALAAPASAQNAPAVSDIEVPAVLIETGDASAGPSSDDALDLANIVQSAAKGVTTVQEAPAIVTVVTADEIRDRQFQDLEQLIDTVPGWSRIGIYHSTFPTPLVRGQVQAVQFLHDGVSLFDPFVNVPSVNRSQPMELIKRVEMITGPGGVLWGSNSLLGILNVITKDAEDVEGIEVGGGLGQGDGDRQVARAYAMGGKADISHGTVKLFGHGSVETYQGPGFSLPLLFFHEPLPQPNSANTYGPLVTTEQKQSLIVTLDGKITLGKLQLRAFFPMGRMYKPAGLSGEPARNIDNPADPMGVAKLNRSDQFDRYGVAEYHTRFAKDQAGFTAHGYLIQFVRGFSPLGVLEPSAALPGGLAFESNLTSYRGGGAFDGDVSLVKQLRVLYGAEAFHEWKPIDTDRSRQGAGNQSDFPAPYDLTRLPILCPREYDPTSHMLVPVAGCPLTFAYDAARTVLGAYINPQFRPNKKLIFDAGARISVAPESMGSKELAYKANPTFAGTIVWNYIPNWHLKLNYAEGFRPPVFNNTLSNGEGVQIGGNPNLLVEQSKAGQAEINARIFKGDRRVRELSFRIDGSYTKLTNLIQVTGGNYGNSGERGLASGEFLGKLYIQGGHRIELGYTYLRGDTSDKGRLKSLPEHWFNLATVWNLVSSRLTATTNLKIVGAAEDPNRLVEYRGLMFDANGNPTGTVTSAATDLVMDRLPPVAELSAGVQYTPSSKISIRATVYDALFAHNYQPDVFFDYEPHLEYLPNPYEGFRAYISALVQY